MARHRRKGLLATTALAVAMVGAVGPALAQVPPPRDPSVPSLFEPHFDQIDGRPQQFRKPGAVTTVSSGAGQTGFDATHSRATRKAKEKARKRARDDAQSLPPVVQYGPDVTVAPVFQRGENAAAARRRATNSAPAPLDATGTIAPRPIRRRVIDPDPFAPVGNYWGTFLVKPALEATAGYNGNPRQRQNSGGSPFEQLAGDVAVRSNWSQHELNADLKGSYIWYNANQLENLSKPDLNLRANGRVDVTRQTKIDVDGRFIYAADNPGDPNLPGDIAKPPTYTVAGGTAGIRHAFNRLELSLKGTIESTEYQNGVTNSGQSVNFEDRNYNQYGTRIRAAYDWLPGVTPFAEYTADERLHNQAFDVNGVNRNSTGQSIRVGSTFQLTGYLVGDFAVGYLERTYVDPVLMPIHGMLYDAALTYYATPLTTLKLNMKTSIDESIINNVSGSFSHDFSVQLDHSFRRWLIGSVKVGYLVTNYVGSPRVDNFYLFSTSLLYKMSRDVWLKTEYRYQRLDSTDTTANYTSNIFLVGLRLQR